MNRDPERVEQNVAPLQGADPLDLFLGFHSLHLGFISWSPLATIGEANMWTRFSVVLIVLVLISSAYGQTPERTIAVTIDDLPVVSTRRDIGNRRKITRNLLGHIKRARVPAIGFVNENKLYDGARRNEQEIDLLRMWLDAGLELGNHTYSHRSLNTIPLSDYQADLLRGEAITRELLARKKKSLRYFRHPFLQTGRTLEIKAQFDVFLQKHGYKVAPISSTMRTIFSRAHMTTRSIKRTCG